VHLSVNIAARKILSPNGKIIFLLLLLFLTHVASAQTFSSPEEAYASYFNDVKVAEEQSWDLWDRDMYGPILLVNPKTREVYSNFPDAGGDLKRVRDVYYGTLPVDINIANTMVHWNGRDWALVMLPLPDYKQDRINLMAHELFHSAQASLGFKGYSPDNGQLDEKDGRIYLRLELEALRKALEAPGQSEMKRNLINALTFREYRYLLYPHAMATENLLELNEGLAEYTGVIISGRNREESVYNFERSINEFVRFPTYVRSFAYETTPVYGYLLRGEDRYWNKRVTARTNLTNFFINDFGITLPSDLKAAVESVKGQYDYDAIAAEENVRDQKRKETIAMYRRTFIEQPHFEIRFEKMKMSFDPRNLMPLDDKGTVYPNIRITDNWGILNVENGALMSPGWDKITLGTPTKIEGGNASGDGWTLQLNSSYMVVQDRSTGNYMMVKR